MKRIISLGLAALIILGTLTGVLISAVYADDPPSSSSSSSNSGSGNPQDPDNNTSGKPNILTNEGILIEKYYYLTKNNQTYLVLVLVDTNIKASSTESFNDFYFSLLTSNFYPLSSKDENYGEIGRAHV